MSILDTTFQAVLNNVVYKFEKKNQLMSYRISGGECRIIIENTEDARNLLKSVFPHAKSILHNRGWKQFRIPDFDMSIPDGASNETNISERVRFKIFNEARYVFIHNGLIFIWHGGERVTVLLGNGLPSTTIYAGKPETSTDLEDLAEAYEPEITPIATTAENCKRVSPFHETLLGLISEGENKNLYLTYSVKDDKLRLRCEDDKGTEELFTKFFPESSFCAGGGSTSSYKVPSFDGSLPNGYSGKAFNGRSETSRYHFINRAQWVQLSEENIYVWWGGETVTMYELGTLAEIDINLPSKEPTLEDAQEAITRSQRRFSKDNKSEQKKGIPITAVDLAAKLADPKNKLVKVTFASGKVMHF